MKQETIPYFDVSSPYDIAYRKNIASYPVGPHTHNAAELYLTHTFLPDVLIDDKVSQVPAGSLIVIPPFCVHQLYHRSDVIYERYILSVHSTWLEQVLFGDREQFSYLKPGAVPLILPLSEAFLEKLTRTSFMILLLFIVLLRAMVFLLTNQREIFISQLKGLMVQRHF